MWSCSPELSLSFLHYTRTESIGAATVRPARGWLGEIGRDFTQCRRVSSKRVASRMRRSASRSHSWFAKNKHDCARVRTEARCPVRRLRNANQHKLPSVPRLEAEPQVRLRMRSHTVLDVAERRVQRSLSDSEARYTWLRVPPVNHESISPRCLLP